MNVRHLALAAAMLVPLSIPAQTSSSSFAGGPYAPIILLVPAGPRTLAMGNTGVTSRDDDALFFNPAMLAVARGMSASYEHYSDRVNGGSLSSVTRFNTGGIAVGMSMLDYRPAIATFPTTRASLGAVGPDQTSIEAVAGIAQVFKGYRIGAAGKFAQDAGNGVQLSRVALDLGVSKDYFQGYTFGLAVQNLAKPISVQCTLISTCSTFGSPEPAVTGGITEANLPIRTTLGVSTTKQVGEFDLLATAALGMYRINFFAPSGGAELGYSWLDGYSIAVRAGLRRPTPGEAAFTAGAGFNVDRLSIDYAMETLDASHVAHRIGLRIR